MPAIRLTGFSGEQPRIIPRLMPETAAQAAINTRLDDGALTPIRRSAQVAEGEASWQTIFHHHDEWLGWDAVVDVVQGPVAQDRLYYTGDGMPKMRIGEDIYPLAVPFPAAPLVPALLGNGRGQNTVHAVAVAATGGTWTLTFRGDTTAALAHDITAAALQTALEALDVFEAGDIEVTGGPGDELGGNPYLIEFTGSFELRRVSLVAAADENLTGPSAGITVTMQTAGVTPGDIVTRVYVYTYVTEFGEESEPSPIGEAVDWQPGQTVTLTGFVEAAEGRGVNRQRIYRSQTGFSGTYLYFVAERPDTEDDFLDDIPVNAFQEALPSSGWTQPDDDLKGLTAMPNGMMAGFVGRDLYFCEPFRPHAWPQRYSLTMDWPIVGLGAIGTSLFVLTEGQPYMVVGTAPENMQSMKLEHNLPCINARGIVDLGYAIAYPSHEGLVVVRADGSFMIMTGNIFNRDGWLRFSPSTMVGAQLSGRYVAFYDTTSPDGARMAGILIIDLSNPAYLIRAGTIAKTSFFDLRDGGLYYLAGDDIYRFDAPGSSPRPQYWRSKRFVLPLPDNFGAIRVDAADHPATPDAFDLEEERQRIIAQNQVLIDDDLTLGALDAAPLDVTTLGGDALDAMPEPPGDSSVGVYADGLRVATITAVNQAVRLPSGFKARTWEIDVSGTVQVEQIVMAKTMDELKQVP